MKVWFTIFLCALILGGAVATGAVLRMLKPLPERVDAGPELPAVEVVVARAEPVRLMLPSQGLVEPTRRTELAAEVAGAVVWVSPKFKNGGEFAAGEDLLRIEPADYEAALMRVRAEVAEAKLNLATEEARVEQAERDWKSLGGGEPTELVRRKPQLAAAQARLEAVRADEERAARDLERTVVKAPYAARVAETFTDLGSYLAPGVRIASIYAVAPYEIRLPLSLDEFALVGSGPGDQGPAVELDTVAGGKPHAWKARVVRREGQVDRASRSIHLVARIEGSEASDALLLPGLFLRARIEGRSLERVYRVPVRAFHDSGSLVVVDPGERLRFRKVETVLRQGNEALVVSGLQDGDRVCLTELEAVIEGMEVSVRPPEAGPGKERAGNGMP
jgi:RND family efflux transporter MFP subunit